MATSLPTAQLNADAPNVGRVPSYKNPGLLLLPSEFTKKSVRESYAASISNEDKLPYSTFTEIWRQFLPNICIQKPQTDLCSDCKSDSLALSELKTMDDEKRRREDAESRAALSALEDHHSSIPLRNHRVNVPRNTTLSTPPKFHLAQICRATKEALQLHVRHGISLRTLPIILHHFYPHLPEEDQTMCSCAAVIAYRDTVLSLALLTREDQQHIEMSLLSAQRIASNSFNVDNSAGGRSNALRTADIQLHHVSSTSRQLASLRQSQMAGMCV